VDRIDAMLAFVTTVELGGFSAAARELARSPASITRAVAALEQRTGSVLLRRTTRALKLTDAGARYLEACQRILAEVEAAEQAAARERATPQGLLAVTAPVTFGRLHVRALVDAFLEAQPQVQVRLLLLDRVVSLIEEGLDVAIRIAQMPDSSLMAAKVGEVRRVLCASPLYLERHKRPRKPSDLSAHDCISFSQITPSDVWGFSTKRGGRLRQVKVRPRLTVNTADAAIDSALAGRGVTRVLSYQIQTELEQGRLIPLLESFAPPPLPVHVVYPAASASSAKLRAFIDLAVPWLRQALAGMLKST
jgi:DNA-binding transcriptional LysR family regulator